MGVVCFSQQRTTAKSALSTKASVATLTLFAVSPLLVVAIVYIVRTPPCFRSGISLSDMGVHAQSPSMAHLQLNRIDIARSYSPSLLSRSMVKWQQKSRIDVP